MRRPLPPDEPPPGDPQEPSSLAQPKAKTRTDANATARAEDKIVAFWGTGRHFIMKHSRGIPSWGSFRFFTELYPNLDEDWHATLLTHPRTVRYDARMAFGRLTDILRVIGTKYPALFRRLGEARALGRWEKAVG